MSLTLLSSRRFYLSLFLLAMLLPGSPAMAAAPPQGAPPITYLRYDTEIEVKPDGNFTVREIQQIQFNGEFSYAFAEIPRYYTTNIINIYVWQGDELLRLGDNHQAGNYEIYPSGNSIEVLWGYQQTSPGDILTFTLEYEVQGGLWVYPDENILEWRAVPADRSGFEVKESRVTVRLPAAVPADALRYTAYGPDFVAKSDANQIIFTATRPIPDGQLFQVQVGFPSTLIQAQMQDWQIDEDTAKLDYRIKAIDVNLDIAAGGRVTVTELQNVAVDAGALYQGYRDISLAYLDDVSDFKVFEGEQAFSPASDACETYCFEATTSEYLQKWIWYDEGERALIVDPGRAGNAQLAWNFPALVRGEETTFRLQYQVEGAIQVDEKAQQLNWTVAFADRDVRIESASLHIDLPPGVSWENAYVQGGTLIIKPDGSTAIERDRPIAPGGVWHISLIMPPNATSAAKPIWQQELEVAQAEAQQAEARRARLQLWAGVAAAIILLGGLLGAWLVWYLWGRDTPTPPLTDYLSEAPSDLPPGIVAYLVDERPTAKGVLASLFHLARLGLLRINMAQGMVLQRNWKESLAKGQSVQTPEGKVIAIPDHLVILFNALRSRIPMDRPIHLSSISSEFQKTLPRVYLEMAEETTRFFNELPAAVRHRWLSIGQWLTLAGIAGGAIAYWSVAPDLGNVALAPPIALLPVGLAFMLISRWMPQRNNLGVEEAARWRAFRSYLENMKEYGNLDEAQKILDDYFAYAVALDVEEAVLAKAEEMGGAMPVWTFPTHLETVPLPDKALSPVEASSKKSATSVLRRRKGSSSSKPPLQPLRLTRQAPLKGDSDEALRDTISHFSLSGLSQQLGETLNQASKGISRSLNVAAGGAQGDTPFVLVFKGVKGTAELTWDIGASTLDVVGDILESASSGGGGGGYSGGSDSSSGSSSFSSSSSSSTRWSSSSSRSSSSSSSSGRSSSSRRSGGGGSRGFG